MSNTIAMTQTPARKQRPRRVKSIRMDRREEKLVRQWARARRIDFSGMIRALINEREAHEAIVAGSVRAA